MTGKTARPYETRRGCLATLTAGTLVISGRAIVETVTAEPVVDAAASVAFIVPFVAARNASGGCNKGRGVVILFP